MTLTRFGRRSVSETGRHYPPTPQANRSNTTVEDKRRRAFVRRSVIVVVILALPMDVAAIVIGSATQAPIGGSDSSSLRDIASEQRAVLDSYEIAFDLAEADVRKLVMDEPILDVDDLAGLADITVEIRPVSVGPIDESGIRGEVLRGDERIAYQIVESDEPVRAVVLMDDTIVIAPES